VIHDPAGQAQVARLLNCGRTKIDTLDSTFHNQPDTRLGNGWHRCWFSNAATASAQAVDSANTAAKLFDNRPAVSIGFRRF
jgi:hypothetical protein